MYACQDIAILRRMQPRWQRCRGSSPPVATEDRVVVLGRVHHGAVRWAAIPAVNAGGNHQCLAVRQQDHCSRQQGQSRRRSNSC